MRVWSILGVALIFLVASLFRSHDTSSNSPFAPGLVLTKNWSGYGVAGNDRFRIDGVETEFTVPNIACPRTSHRLRSVSVWDGLGGQSKTTSLPQSGVLILCQSGVRSMSFWASWFDRSSAATAEPPATMDVVVGDQMSVTIVQIGRHRYRVSASEQSARTHVTVASYRGVESGHNVLPVGNTAECVVERPARHANGGYVPLANFGTVKFTKCVALIRPEDRATLIDVPSGIAFRKQRGVVVPLNQVLQSSPIEMISDSQQPLASELTAATDSGVATFRSFKVVQSSTKH